jgi:hypothetical protein
MHYRTVDFVPTKIFFQRKRWHSVVEFPSNQPGIRDNKVCDVIGWHLCNFYLLLFFSWRLEGPMTRRSTNMSCYHPYWFSSFLECLYPFFSFIPILDSFSNTQDNHQCYDHGHAHDQKICWPSFLALRIEQPFSSWMVSRLHQHFWLCHNKGDAKIYRN